MAKPQARFAELLDSAVLRVVQALNAFEQAPNIRTIDVVRKALEEHGLAWAALGAAYPRVFTPGPTLEQLEERGIDDDHSKRDTSPGFRSRLPPPPPIGDDTPPPLPRRRR